MPQSLWQWRKSKLAHQNQTQRRKQNRQGENSEIYGLREGDWSLNSQRGHHLTNQSASWIYRASSRVGWRAHGWGGTFQNGRGTQTSEFANGLRNEEGRNAESKKGFTPNHQTWLSRAIYSANTSKDTKGCPRKRNLKLCHHKPPASTAQTFQKLLTCSWKTGYYSGRRGPTEASSQGLLKYDDKQDEQWPVQQRRHEWRAPQE